MKNYMAIIILILCYGMLKTSWCFDSNMSYINDNPGDLFSTKEPIKSIATINDDFDNLDNIAFDLLYYENLTNINDKMDDITSSIAGNDNQSNLSSMQIEQLISKNLSNISSDSNKRNYNMNMYPSIHTTTKTNLYTISSDKLSSPSSTLTNNLINMSSILTSTTTSFDSEATNITDAPSVDCWDSANSIMNFYSCEKEGCVCDFSTLFVYLFLILGLIAFSGSIFLILGYVIYKELREKPGDMVFGIAVSYGLLSMNYIITSSYRIVYDNNLDPSGGYCLAASMVELTAIISSYLYSIGFCIYNVRTLQVSLKKDKFTRLTPYTFLILIVLYIIFLARHSYLLGMSIVGTCNGRTSDAWNNTLIEMVLAFLLVIISLYTLYHIKKYTPGCDKINEARKNSLRYYYKYLLASSIIFAVISILLIINSIIADTYRENNTDIGDLQSLKYIIQTARLLAALLVSVVRYFDPFIKSYMVKLLELILTCGTKNTSSRSNTTTVIDTKNDQLNLSLSFANDRNRLDSLAMNMNIQALTSDQVDTAHWLTKLSHNMKVQVIYTILSGIIYFNSTAREAAMEECENLNEKFKNNKESYYKYLAKQAKDYRINDDVMLANIPEIAEEMKNKEYNTIDGQLTIFAPQIFSEWIEVDKSLINFQESLNLKKNYNRIQKAGKATGGKSGEFFFFSYDNKVIIKTITDEEAEVLIETLDKFSLYYNENKDTLIAKIYGLFTYQRADVKEKYNLIVMRNVNGYPNEFIERTYDMKGSTYDREVLKNQYITNLSELKNQGTLKDQDFLKYEKKLNVTYEYQRKIIEILERDVNLLKSCGLIDYSLIVYVINKKKFNDLYEGGMALSTFNDKSSFIQDQQQAQQGEYPISSTSLTSVALGDCNNKKLIPSKAKSRKATEIEMNSDIATRKSIISEASSSNSSYRCADPTLQNPIYSIKSIKGDIYYHIGIIDYLQLYTLQKKLEKFSKKLVKMNIKLDTSSQDPITYAERFIKFARLITIE